MEKKLLDTVINGEYESPGKADDLESYRAVVYVRTSTVEQAGDDKVSIPDQIAWAKKVCSDKGWKFVGHYADTVPGDTEFEQRPEGARLLEDAKFDLFNLVLFYHSSRLAREVWVGEKVISILQRLKIQVYIRNAPIEPVLQKNFVYGNNIGADYMHALTLVGDKQENVARSERVTSGFRNLAERGTLAFGGYGLRKVIKHKIVEGKQRYTWNFKEIPGEVAVLKRISREYLNGGSFRKIVKDLIKDGIPSPTGNVGEGSWTAATIRNLLSDPKYNGKVRWGRKLGSKYREGRAESGKQKRVITSSDKWIVRDCTNSPKIISDDAWNRIQDRIKQRGKISGRQLASDSILPGLVYCGDCQRRAICRTRRFKKDGIFYIRSVFIDQSYYRMLKCRRHLISAKKLESLVLMKLKSRLSEIKESDIGSLLESREESTKLNLADSINRIESQLRSFDSKKTKLTDLYLDSGIDRQEFDKQKAKIEAEENVLLQEKSRLQSIINDQKKQKDAIKTLGDLLTMFEDTEDERIRKEMIHRIIDKIFVFRDHVQILYRFGTEGTEWLNVNPHPCGYFGDSKRACKCLPGTVSRYQKRISGPILDRIDIHVDVPSVDTQKLIDSNSNSKSKSSEKIQKEVQKARDIQSERFKGLKIKSNAEMSTRDVKKFCPLSTDCHTMMISATASMNLSARAYFKVVKVSLTISDLSGEKNITTNHLAEALQYRPKDND